MGIWIPCASFVESSDDAAFAAMLGYAQVDRVEKPKDEKDKDRQEHDAAILDRPSEPLLPFPCSSLRCPEVKKVRCQGCLPTSGKGLPEFTSTNMESARACSLLKPVHPSHQDTCQSTCVSVTFVYLLARGSTSKK